MLGLLEDECTNRNATLEDSYKKHFFGLYHAKANDFRFLPGEKTLLKEIGKYINQVIGDVEIVDNLEAFKPPTDYKMSRKDTCRLFGCTFFGKKSNDKLQPQLDMANASANDETDLTETEKGSMKSALLHKLRDMFKSDEKSLIDKIEIIKEKSRITALVQCIVCEKDDGIVKTITIQRDPVKNSKAAYWNLSNLKKHLKKHTNDGLKKSKDNNETSIEIMKEDDLFQITLDESVYENHETFTEDVEIVEEIEDEDIVLEEIVIDMNEYENMDGRSMTGIQSESATMNNSSAYESMEELTTSSDSIDVNSTEFAIYIQLSQQNHDMKSAIQINKEETEKMYFNLGDENVVSNLNVIKINGDGNCLFGSLIHQLFHHDLKSEEHKQHTKDLRATTVQFIRENLNNFTYEIEGRVLEERDAINTDDVTSNVVTEQDCQTFLDEKLSNCAFAGAESFKAITQMYNVNILIVNESGPAYYPVGFNSKYYKTVFVAYRLGQNSTERRNHYDSIAEVDVDTLCNFLAGKHAKRIDLLENSSFIELE